MSRFLQRYFAQLTALVLSLLSLGFLVWFVWEVSEVTAFNCQRLEPAFVNCTLRKSVWGFAVGEVQSLTAIRAVEWSEDCDDEGCAYAVVLQTTTGQRHHVRATEQDAAQMKAFKEFVRGEDAPPEIALRVGGAWWDIAIAVVVGGLVVGAFWLPWFLEQRAARE